MADLESRFPDLCGDVTIDCVHMGSGSLAGIRLCTRGKKSLSTMKRLEYFHEHFIQHLLQMTDLELKMMGYRRIGTRLFSIFSHRLYSYIDTEHILCKVYVLLTISYPSRTISKNPMCGNTFTWPMPKDANYWTEEFRREMDAVVLEAYKRKLANGSNSIDWRKMLLDSYPLQLRYDFDDVPAIPPLKRHPVYGRNNRRRHEEDVLAWASERVSI
jgi:hypothetical protein